MIVAEGRRLHIRISGIKEKIYGAFAAADARGSTRM